MYVEITAVSIVSGNVIIEAIDVSEENLQRIERTRDDGFERELKFVFDTHKRQDFLYLRGWLKRQKATRGCVTWGEALNAVYGTVASISKKYRVWD